MTLYMKGFALDELVKRLRSGQYKQGREKLCVPAADVTQDDMYCCLGVLCEIAVEAGVVSRNVTSEEIYNEEADEVAHMPEVYYGEYMDSTLPHEVIAWAGVMSEIDDRNEASNEDDYEGMGRFGQESGETLAGMNDSGVPFDEIADFIERNVERV